MFGKIVKWWKEHPVVRAGVRTVAFAAIGAGWQAYNQDGADVGTIWFAVKTAATYSILAVLTPFLEPFVGFWKPKNVEVPAENAEIK